MDASKRILIAGGSGLIGTRLSEILQNRGYEVWHLSRNSQDLKKTKTFLWDVKNEMIDPAAFEAVGVVINLAGVGVADRRWSSKRKKEILESRTKSTALLRRHLASTAHAVQSFICASGIGYYGPGDENTVFIEDEGAGNDFLAEVTRAWEKESDKFSDLGIRVVKMRIGIVLSNRGGALAPIAKTVRYFVGAPLGSGKQYMSWIHIDDLCHMFLHAIEHREIKGPYNAVAPSPVTNTDFIKAIATTLNKPLLLPNIPAFVLKLMLGELSTVVLDGARVSSRKIQNTGFTFRFDALPKALSDLLR